MDKEREIFEETREELQEEVKEFNNEEIHEAEKITNEFQESEVEELEKCLNCGKTLQKEEIYCAKCGIKRGNKKKVMCTNCGTEVEVGEKYCTKCGEKIDINLDSVVNTVKQKYKETTEKIDKDKVKKIALIVVIAIAVIFVGVKVLPKIFISTEKLLAKGQYEKAYKNAKDSEKENIAKENLIAVLCNDVIENYKDPSSFDLRDAWIDEDKKVVVMKTGGKNSYGGVVFSYDYFTYDEADKKYEFYCSLSSLQKEDYSKYDDYDESLEKILKNAARTVVSEVIKKDKYKLSDDSIDNINNLFKQDLLDRVQLLNITTQDNI